MRRQLNDRMTPADTGAWREAVARLDGEARVADLEAFVNLLQ